jgi:N-acetylglutamate synthase-like GNAT family acetyltransferase
MKVRNATANDLDAIMAVESCWPEDQRATIDHFRSRLERFPQGFWVGEVVGIIVGLTTNCLIHYDPKDPGACKSWAFVTNHGYLYPRREITDANAIYTVSTAILEPYRRRGLHEAFLRKRLETTRELGLAYAVSGTMLPGYDAFCRRHGEIPAYEYCLLRVNGKPLDPLVRKLTAFGYEIPDERHVIADYYPSPESRDYGALMVYRNKVVSRP